MTHFGGRLESSCMVEENPPSDKPTETHKGSRPRLKKKKVRAKSVVTTQTSFERVVAIFSACARCSYFFTGYRAIFQDEQVQQQVNQSDDIWLKLTWSRQIADLLHGSFGREITADLIKYQLCCPDCLRLYSYESRENDSQYLLVQLDPQQH